MLDGAAQQTPLHGQNEHFSHKARLTETLSSSVASGISPKRWGNASLYRSKEALGEKKKSSQLSLITNPAGFWKSKLHHALPFSAHTSVQNYVPGEAGSVPCAGHKLAVPWDNAEHAEPTHVKTYGAHSFLEYLITPGILLTLFIASGSLCF